MSDNGVEPTLGTPPETPKAPAPMATEASTCPTCGQVFEPLPFYRERRMLYAHLKAEHGWSPEQVDELRGKPKPKAPRPTGTVKRPPASPKVSRPAPAKPQSDFARRLQRMGELQPRISSSGNTLLLQMAIMVGWFPPPLLVEFRSDPQTGIPLPQWDRPTEFGRAIMLDERECMVYAAGWAFSENTAFVTWVEEHVGSIAPPVAALACAVVTFKHIAAMRQLANSPAVLAFKDQLEAAMAQAKRQMEAEAEAQRQTPPAA